MALPSKSFQQFVDDQVAAWSAFLGFQPTLQKGDALFALMQTTAAQLTFLQAQVQLVNAIARAQTSTGADLDTFFAQFAFTRLPGQRASGPAVLGKLSPAANQVLAPVGSIVQTVGGAIQYQLIADPNQPAFNVALNAYVMAIGQTSITVTVQALLIGSAYNVTTGQLAQIGTPIPGIDTVTNPAPIANGADAESDPRALARFVLYLNSLSKATYGAIVNAIEGVQQGIELGLTENLDVAGNPRPGEFVATIDDGSGSPPASLITAVINAVEQVRGFTILPEVVAVTVVNVSAIVMAIRVAPGFDPLVVELAVRNAIVAGVDALGIDGTVFVSSVEAMALAVPGVVAVRPGTTIDGVALDLTITSTQAPRVLLGAVTVSSY